ncbi:MAG TPA: hypothetical protein VME18_08835 [Acidobacteriaceae bacterium]|nr:hypothetical protein [Acidobacteriaceae bacterium]
MRYSVFEQAAIEASAGLKEIDVEIEQLDTKKQSLEAKRELLETLVHQLWVVLPMSNQGSPADAADKAGVASNAPEAKAFSPRKEDWPAFVQNSNSNSPVERK